MARPTVTQSLPSLSGSQVSQDPQSVTQAAAELPGHPWNTKDLIQFLKYAIRWAHEQEGYYDHSEENWRSPVFHFTRMVQSYYEDGVKVTEALHKIDPVIPRAGGWEALETDNEYDPRSAFYKMWPEIKCRMDEDVLRQAFTKSGVYPFGPPKERYQGKLFNRFFAFCGWLQVIMGDHRNIYLPTRKLAEPHLFNCRPSTISGWRQIMVREGYLHEARRHVFNSKGGSRATEFVFDEGYREQFKEELRKRLK